MNDYISITLDIEVEVEKQYKVDNDIIFSINKLDSTKYGLQQKYPDIYCFIKENKTEYLISKNYKILCGLCGYINRTCN